MKVFKARKFKIIDPNKGKALSLNQTMRRYKKCLNFYLFHIGHKRDKNDRKLYAEARDKYHLPTGLIQTARDVAQEQYDSYKNNENNHTFPHFTGMTTVRYDNRTITFSESKKNNEGSQGHFKLWTSISTINGRVKVPVVGNPKHAQELLDREFASVQMMYKDGEYHLHIIYKDDKSIPKEPEFEYFIGGPGKP